VKHQLWYTRNGVIRSKLSHFKHHQSL